MKNLTGSEKQIKWAEKIMVKFLEDLKADIEDGLEEKNMIEKFEAKTDSKFWIDCDQSCDCIEDVCEKIDGKVR